MRNYDEMDLFRNVNILKIRTVENVNEICQYKTFHLGRLEYESHAIAQYNDDKGWCDPLPSEKVYLNTYFPERPGYYIVKILDVKSHVVILYRRA